MRANYRPEKLNNTQWMNLNIWDYFIVTVEGVSALVTSHPLFPDDTTKRDVLWRVQAIINKVSRHICWYASSDSRDNPVEYVKEHVTRAINRQLKKDG